MGKWAVFERFSWKSPSHPSQEITANAGKNKGGKELLYSVGGNRNFKTIAVEGSVTIPQKLKL